MNDLTGALKRIEDVLNNLDRLGGIGYEKHGWVTEALAECKAIREAVPEGLEEDYIIKVTVENEESQYKIMLVHKAAKILQQITED